MQQPDRQQEVMGRRKVLALLLLIVFFCWFCCASAASPGFALWRRLWSATTDSRIAISSRSNVKFESGYSVETVFDGSRHGIEPFSVQVLPGGGELLVLDSENSNIYKISLPLSKYSRPKLVAGSTHGSSGHVDGKPHEARMNHPKGLTVDDKGNIYVADARNKAIRKISDSGVTTIAVGKSRGVGRIGLRIEDAKFSDDFEVVYVSSSCSLLVVDRGNQAIREIQLNFDDCADRYGARLSLGITMLFAAAFFGYMLALVQRRWVIAASSAKEEKTTTRSYSASPQRPLIPPETETRREEEEEEGFFTSLKEFTASAASSILPIFCRILSRRHAPSRPGNQQQPPEANVWPSQESLAVPDDEPPPLETQTHSPCKTYAFMSKNSEKLQQLRHDTAYFDGWGEAWRSSPSIL